MREEERRPEVVAENSNEPLVRLGLAVGVNRGDGNDRVIDPCHTRRATTALDAA